MVVMEAGFRDLGVREIASRHPAFISFPASVKSKPRVRCKTNPGWGTLEGT